MYHNTVPESGETLKQYTRVGNKQDALVLQFFQSHRNEEFTPFEVQSFAPGLGLAPITSVRRALTDLECDGLIEKTNIKRLGKYGRNNNTWRLKVA